LLRVQKPLNRRRFLAALATIGVVPPVLAGCSALGGGSAAPPAAGDGPESAELKVGVLPIVGAAPLTLGVKEGLFGGAGLTVTPQRIQSGALSLPGLIAGDFQVLFTNYVSAIAAVAQNIDVVIIAEASRAQPDNFGVVVKADSALDQPAALVGKTIGVNALNNIATLTTSSVLGVNGVTPEQVTFVEIPFPEMATALDAGRVDAAFLPEPFLTSAKRSLGVKTVFDPTSGPTADLPIDGYVVTRQFADENANTVKAFREALVEAQRRCADRAVLEPVLVEATGIPPENAALISASAYPTTINATSIQRVADLMLQFGAIKAPVDVSKMVSSS
jgi:NitT/TauT family transport system substrate-binding protein